MQFVAVMYCSVLQCAAVCCSVVHTSTFNEALISAKTERPIALLTATLRCSLLQSCVALCFSHVSPCFSVLCMCVHLTSCSVLQCVAVCCSVLQCVAVCCGALHCIVLQCVAVRCSVLHLCTQSATQCKTLQCIATHCNTLQHTVYTDATHCNAMQHTATHCRWWCLLMCCMCVHLMRLSSPRRQNAQLCRCVVQWSTLQRTATHCNTLQHAATHCNADHDSSAAGQCVSVCCSVLQR